MRLGTRIAVINDTNEILLSKRGDFGVWALPGGRVDSGELLHESAIREVREETGLEVEIVRPIGLYFQEGRSRMNVLYQAKPIGGELFKRSDETLDNRFFARDELPEDLFGQFYIDHAFTQETYVYTIKTSFLELLKLDLKLRWRWLQNLFAGRPEPKFVQFKVYAVGMVFDAGRKSVVIIDGELPRLESHGKENLSELIATKFHPNKKWKWVGLWQTTSTNTLEFVFESVDNSTSHTFAPLDAISSERDRKIAQLSLRQSSEIWLEIE